MSELHSYVDVMIADRCRRTTDILLAKLIELEVDGEELTVDDIRGFVAALVAGASYSMTVPTLVVPVRDDVTGWRPDETRGFLFAEKT